jgi:hypothetical protein
VVVWIANVSYWFRKRVFFRKTGLTNFSVKNRVKENPHALIFSVTQTLVPRVCKSGHRDNRQSTPGIVQLKLGLFVIVMFVYEPTQVVHGLIEVLEIHEAMRHMPSETIRIIVIAASVDKFPRLLLIVPLSTMRMSSVLLS